MASRFHKLKVAGLHRSTADAVIVTFDAPKSFLHFNPGQYLTLRATIDGQDANTVDPASIKAYVHGAFYPSAKSGAAHRHRAKSSTANNAVVDVLNGGHTKGLAAQVTAQLAGAGYHVGTPGNTSDRSTTAVLYGTGAEAEASQLAAIFGTTATASTSVAAGHIEILLGSTTTAPADVPAVGTASASPTSTPSSVIPTRGPQGGALVAKGGIPCVN